ncbi:MAG: tetratricopeptide repeat protein, partial [Planctomycetota bacterium]|nr:tetratricopeptide repeat protein [Planctomycetota bacterium]
MRTTQWFILATVISISMVGGCQSGRFSWLTGSGEDWQQAQARQELKKPTQLDLTYAQMAESNGHGENARSFYERVLSDDPKSVDAILGLARIDQLAGRNSAAEQGYQQALKLDGSNPKVLDAAGQYYVDRKQWVRAIQYLNSATLAAPTETTYRYHLAVALARTGQLDEARPHFVRTVGDAEADYNIGYILYEQEEYAQAKAYFLKAVAKDPTLPEPNEMLEELRSMQEDRLMLASASEGAEAPVVAELPPPPGYGHATPVPHEPSMPIVNLAAEFAPQTIGPSIQPVLQARPIESNLPESPGGIDPQAIPSVEPHSAAQGVPTELESVDAPAITPGAPSIHRRKMAGQFVGHSAPQFRSSDPVTTQGSPEQ